MVVDIDETVLDNSPEQARKFVQWVEGSEDQLSRFWGSRFPREDFEARLAVVPDVQRAVLQDAGHMLHHDQPEALAALLEPFLA